MTPEARRQIETTIAHLQSMLDADCDCPEANTVTVKDLWDRYLETLPDVDWVRQMKSGMKRLIAAVGHVVAAKLKITDWENFRDSKEIREGYESSTRNLMIRRLRTCFNWAVDSGRMAWNPILRIKFEKAKPKRETEISVADEPAILELMGESMKAFFLVAIDSGMRREEIRLLEWTDIDREGRTITIPSARTKTRKARVGRITSRALDALTKIPPTPGCPWVFTSPVTKRPYGKTWVHKNWRKAADGAELKPAAGDKSVHLHDARATTASRLFRLGASLPAVQQILGHSSLQSTEKYVRIQSEDVKAAHQLLENATRKGPQRSPVSKSIPAVEHAACSPRLATGKR